MFYLWNLEYAIEWDTQCLLEAEFVVATQVEYFLFFDENYAHLKIRL